MISGPVSEAVHDHFLIMLEQVPSSCVTRYARSVTPPSPPTSPWEMMEMMEGGDDTASAACTSRCLLDWTPPPQPLNTPVRAGETIEGPVTCGIDPIPVQQCTDWAGSRPAVAGGEKTQPMHHDAIGKAVWPTSLVRPSSSLASCDAVSPRSRTNGPASAIV